MTSNSFVTFLFYLRDSRTDVRVDTVNLKVYTKIEGVAEQLVVDSSSLYFIQENKSIKTNLYVYVSTVPLEAAEILVDHLMDSFAA